MTNNPEVSPATPDEIDFSRMQRIEFNGNVYWMGVDAMYIQRPKLSRWQKFMKWITEAVHEPK